MTASRVIARDRADLLGEGPIWSSRDNAVYWVDILGQRINRLQLDDDSVSTWELPETIGWLIERRSAPGFIAGVGRRFVALQLDPLRIETLADPEPACEGNRANDAKADCRGRIFAGTMPLSADRPSGNVYRLDANGITERVDSGYTIPNGPAITADGSWMLHTDTALRCIFRHVINDDGTLGTRQLFIEFAADWGNPDGMTFDAEGHLWVACWGGASVRRFAPDGVHERAIALPAAQITSCVFAGADLDRMFVTSASVDCADPKGGALFEIDPGTTGLPTLSFSG